MDNGAVALSGQPQLIARAAKAVAVSRKLSGTLMPAIAFAPIRIERGLSGSSSSRLPAGFEPGVLHGRKNWIAVEGNSSHEVASKSPGIGNDAALSIPNNDAVYPPSQRLFSPSPFVPQSGNRLAFYAYSFWRPGSPRNTEAAAPQYGGSQSGLIGTYRLTQNDKANVALLMRAAIAPGRLADKELALGLRAQPIASVPITLTAERRLRSNSRDQFAIYAAGSKENIALLPGIKARGFAQAGVVPGKNPNIFYDAGIRAEHSITSASSADIYVGAGAWTGGQRGVSRFDVGPSLRANITLGATQLDISADWRFRVGGNARPKHGPAITISTGF